MGQDENNKEKKGSSWFKDFMYEKKDGEKPVVDTKKSSEKKTTFPNQQTNTAAPAKNTVVHNDFMDSESSSEIVSGINPEVISKVQSAYESNFVKLNKPGVDFFEYFNLVKKQGFDKPGAYEMALDMTTGMNGELSKEILISQADGYISQINDLHQTQLQKGEAKKQEIVTNRDNEQKSLTDNLRNLKEQLESVQTQIQATENKLSVVDSKYQPQLSDIEQRLMANDLVKNKMVVDLNKVKQGISSI